LLLLTHVIIKCVEHFQRICLYLTDLPDITFLLFLDFRW